MSTHPTQPSATGEAKSTNKSVSPGYSDPRNLKSAAWWIGCFCLVYVSSFFLGGLNPPSLTLDTSWQTVLEYAAERHFQFGRDIVFNYGPFGFLVTSFSQGHLIAARVAFAFFWSAVVAISAMELARRTARWASYPLLAWLVVFALSRDFDQIAFFVMACGTLILLDGDRAPRWRIPVFILAFAVLSLIKFTYLVAAAASLLIVVGVRFLEKKFRGGLALAALACAAFLACWIGAGQSVINLPSWIRKSLEITLGYSSAMSTPPKDKVFIALVVALILFVWAWSRIIKNVALRLPQIGMILTLALYVFMAWKEGIVRADAHVFVFLLFLPLASSFLFLRDSWGGLSSRSKSLLVKLYCGIIAICLLTAHFQEANSIVRPVSDLPARFADRARMIEKAIRGQADGLYPQRTNLSLDHEPHLDAAKAAIGNSTVDVMNYYQWAALANQMNYRPRPVIQGYSAFTPALQNLNGDYFRSSARPQFILLSQQAIDSRFPTLEDSAALNFALANYAPVVQDDGFLVLRQSSAVNPSFQLVDRQVLRFGEQLDVRRWARRPLFLSVIIRPSLVGRFVEFIYQPPPLYVRISEGEDQKRYRLVPEMAKLPFLLSPMLDNNDDVLALYNASPAKVVESLMIEPPRRRAYEFEPTLDVRLYTATSFPESKKRPSQ